MCLFAFQRGITTRLRPHRVLVRSHFFKFQTLIFSITLHSTCNPKAAVFQTRGQRTHHSAIMSLQDGGSRFVRVARRGYKFLAHLENRGVNPSRLADSVRRETTAHPFRVKALRTLRPPRRLA